MKFELIARGEILLWEMCHLISFSGGWEWASACISPWRLDDNRSISQLLGCDAGAEHITTYVMESRFGDVCVYAHMCLRVWGCARSYFSGNGCFGFLFCFVTVAAEHFSDHPLLMLLSLCHYGDTGCYTSANQRRGKGVLKSCQHKDFLCCSLCAQEVS